MVNQYRCPHCNKKGTWRRGVHFDNQLICYKCWFSWEPGTLKTEDVTYNPKLIEDLKNMEGGGI